jgi:Zn finger protein HypA/HybF involved in hydrogenase expression
MWVRIQPPAPLFQALPCFIQHETGLYLKQHQRGRSLIERAAVAMRRKLPARNCETCGSFTKRRASRYCSVSCSNVGRGRASLERWQRGEEPGHANGHIKGTIRQYLLDKRGERCENCGWAERNPVTGKVPVQIDHIDGDWSNSSEENLRILCPNCHSLTPSFGSLNNGRGRPKRRILGAVA